MSRLCASLSLTINTRARQLIYLKYFDSFSNLYFELSKARKVAAFGESYTNRFAFAAMRRAFVLAEKHLCTAHWIWRQIEMTFSGIYRYIYAQCTTICFFFDPDSFSYSSSSSSSLVCVIFECCGLFLVTDFRFFSARKWQNGFSVINTTPSIVFSCIMAIINN